MRIPILMIFVIIIVSILLDAYIYGSIERRHAHRGTWSRLYLISSVLCWLFIIVVLCMPRRSQDDGIQFIMWSLYAYLSVYIVKFCYVILSIIGLIPMMWHRKPWRTGIYIGMPIGVIIFGAMWYGATIGRSKIEVTRIVVESERLPRQFDGYRIVQFSDAHVGTWGNDTQFVSTLVDSVNNLKPDLIVFTGDIVNRRTSEIVPFIDILSCLKAKDGVLSVLGNHDYGDYISWKTSAEKNSNMEEMYAVQKQIGWKLLDNDHTFIARGNDSIAIIGVGNWGEPPFKQYGDLAKAYPLAADSAYNVNDNRFKVLLSHNPEHWNQHVSYETNIDLTLSGHTHAMQIMFTLGDWRWSPSQYKYEQWGGMYERVAKDGSPIRIYVNIGSGEVGMPSRIGATSEITEITLRRPQKSAAR